MEPHSIHATLLLPTSPICGPSRNTDASGSSLLPTMHPQGGKRAWLLWTKGFQDMSYSAPEKARERVWETQASHQ